MSKLLQNFIKQSIHEEKKHAPDVFKLRAKKKVEALPASVPCMWCGNPSKGGICADCTEELTSTPKMTEAKLNDLPYGALELDDEGRILAFNRHEAEMSRVLHKQIIGKNFFTEVVVCTDVQEFYSRYEAFLESGDSASKEFEYTYTFSSKRHVRVLISFVRVDENRALVVSKKMEEVAQRKSA